MGRLIAVTGFSGAGKSTAADLLGKVSTIPRVYAGQIVLDEVKARGLSSGPENEKLVRLALRREHGPLALCTLIAPQIIQNLTAGSNVFLDAVLSEEELNYYRTNCDSDMAVLAICARFDIRAQRLAERADRKSTAEELRIRDDVDMIQLRTNDVIEIADWQITNEASLSDFQANLMKINF